MDGVVRMVGVVRVITGQGGQFGQVVGTLDRVASIMFCQKINGFTCTYHQV